MSRGFPRESRYSLFSLMTRPTCTTNPLQPEFPISGWVSKEPTILHDGDGSGIHERRQLSHRAHNTISRCRELTFARQQRQLSARLHTLQLIRAHSSPWLPSSRPMIPRILATLVLD